MANAKILMGDTILRFAKDYKDMVAAAEFLKEIGTTEQIADECQAAAEKAKAEQARAEAEAKAAKADAQKAKDKAAEIVAKANDQALEVLREAEQKGQSIVDGASSRAAEIQSRAEQDAAIARSGIAGQVAQLTSTKVSLEQDVATLNHVVETKRIETEELEKRLAKAQAQIAKLLG